MVRKGESWKGVKKGELERKGYSNLAFQVAFLPLTNASVKFIVTAIRGTPDTLITTYGQEVTSRGFPGICIHEGRARSTSGGWASSLSSSSLTLLWTSRERWM